MSKRVLISVFDKRGLLEYSRALVDAGCELVSTGGTAKQIRGAGLPVTEVSDLTGSPEMLDDRVKTLHPKVHAGLIADRGNESHLRELIEHRIKLFDALIINLYPMEAEIARPDATFESVTKNIDIGGPAMMRSAFKGRMPVVMDPADVPELVERLRAGTHLEHAYCDRLINKGRETIANYTTREAEWSSGGDFVGILGHKVQDLCYGESKGWKAAMYRAVGSHPVHRLACSNFRQVGGGDPSYINVTDIARSRRTMVQIVATYQASFGVIPHVVIADKHGIACGIGVSVCDPITALTRAIDSNREAIHGGTVLYNRHIDGAFAKTLREYGKEPGTKRMLDVTVGASVNEDAQEVLERKTGKGRMFENPALADITAADIPRRIVRMDDYGDFLVQEGEPFVFTPSHPLMERHGRELEESDVSDLVLADAICRTTPSNTVTLVKGQMLLGNGCSRPSRVEAAWLAIEAARRQGHQPRLAVAASDSFFPFADGPEMLAGAGISAVFATSGATRDDEVRDACLAGGMTLWRLPDALARGFYAH